MTITKQTKVDVWDVWDRNLFKKTGQNYKKDNN